MRARVAIVAALHSCGWTTGVQAQAELTPAAIEADAEEESRWTLGARGLGGGVFSEEERRGGGGGTLLVAYGIVPERWEVEFGLSLIGVQDGPVGVFEVIGKRIFERQGAWAPHLMLGPAFSLDFGNDAKPSGGFLLGTGVTHWFHERVGWTGDAAYRFLIGAEVENVLTVALGLAFRL
jgi:hypothetical protein